MNQTTESPIQSQPPPEKLFDNYNPVDVDVKEATGTLFLGILAIILLILYARSNRRYQELVMKVGKELPGTWHPNQD